MPGVRRTASTLTERALPQAAPSAGIRLHRFLGMRVRKIDALETTTAATLRLNSTARSTNGSPAGPPGRSGHPGRSSLGFSMTVFDHDGPARSPATPGRSATASAGPIPRPAVLFVLAGVSLAGGAENFPSFLRLETNRRDCPQWRLDRKAGALVQLPPINRWIFGQEHASCRSNKGLAPARGPSDREEQQILDLDGIGRVCRNLPAYSSNLARTTPSSAVGVPARGRQPTATRNDRIANRGFRRLDHTGAAFRSLMQIQYWPLSI